MISYDAISDCLNEYHNLKRAINFDTSKGIGSDLSPSLFNLSSPCSDLGLGVVIFRKDNKIVGIVGWLGAFVILAFTHFLVHFCPFPSLFNFECTFACETLLFMHTCTSTKISEQLL